MWLESGGSANVHVLAWRYRRVKLAQLTADRIHWPPRLKPVWRARGRRLS